MARRRLKMTGFARFLIAMLFIAPAAFLGASYMNGEDGVQKLKEIVGIEKTTIQSSTTTNEYKGEFSDEIKRLEDEIRSLRTRVGELEEENQNLKAQLEER